MKRQAENKDRLILIHYEEGYGVNGQRRYVSGDRAKVYTIRNHRRG